MTALPPEGSPAEEPESNDTAGGKAISATRIIALSIASMGVYRVYRMYRTWKQHRDRVVYRTRTPPPDAAPSGTA